MAPYAISSKKRRNPIRAGTKQPHRPNQISLITSPMRDRLRKPPRNIIKVEEEDAKSGYIQRADGPILSSEPAPESTLVFLSLELGVEEWAPKERINTIREELEKKSVAKELKRFIKDKVSMAEFCDELDASTSKYLRETPFEWRFSLPSNDELLVTASKKHREATRKQNEMRNHLKGSKRIIVILLTVCNIDDGGIQYSSDGQMPLSKVLNELLDQASTKAIRQAKDSVLIMVTGGACLQFTEACQDLLDYADTGPFKHIIGFTHPKIADDNSLPFLSRFLMNFLHHEMDIAAFLNQTIVIDEHPITSESGVFYIGDREVAGKIETADLCTQRGRTPSGRRVCLYRAGLFAMDHNPTALEEYLDLQEADAAAT